MLECYNWYWEKHHWFLLCGSHRLEAQTATIYKRQYPERRWGTVITEFCLHGYLDTLEETIFTLPGECEKQFLQPSIMCMNKSKVGYLKVKLLLWGLLSWYTKLVLYDVLWTSLWRRVVCDPRTLWAVHSGSGRYLQWDLCKNPPNLLSVKTAGAVVVLPSFSCFLSLMVASAEHRRSQIYHYICLPSGLCLSTIPWGAQNSKWAGRDHLAEIFSKTLHQNVPSLSLI